MVHFNCEELFPFNIPKPLAQGIKELENGINNHVSYVDCLREEIRSLAHGCTYDSVAEARENNGITEDEAENIIDYFCR